MSSPDFAAIAAQPKLLRAARALAVDAVTAEVVAAFQRGSQPGLGSSRLRGESGDASGPPRRLRRLVHSPAGLD